jgi:DNA-binding SARP family transcriptional activator
MGRPDLRLLGGFDFRAGSGRPVPIARRKVQALLAYLACHSGQAQPRDKLAALLWPDMEDEQARANLRKALFILRSALTPTAVGLRLVEDVVALDGTALHVDVLAFERLARQGLSGHLKAGHRWTAQNRP